MTSDASWEKYPWVKAYLQRIADFFWMNDWDIKIQVADLSDRASDGKSFSVHARCEAIWAYRMATIFIDRGYWESHCSEPTKSAELTLIHEYLHAVLSGLGNAMQTVYRLLEPADGPYKQNIEATAFSIYRDHEEHLVSTLSYAFHQAIGPAEPVEAQEEAA